MRVLTVPNWSFGRNKPLCRKFAEIFESRQLSLHYFQGDLDHNRTVTAFSGDSQDVSDALFAMCEVAFDTIDLNHHVGVHPRIGALDVCPIVLPDDAEDLSAYLGYAEELGEEMARRFDLPIYLYERSERGRHESDLPSLRRAGFGGALGRILRPDFGPIRAHPRLGVTVLGVRNFLVAMNINLGSDDPTVAKKLASEIRSLRSQGDERFLGVRALGFPLHSRGQSQVSLNLTLPNLSPIDPIIEWVRHESVRLNVIPVSTELIGVIRPRDVEHATRLAIRDEQIVPA